MKLSISIAVNLIAMQNGKKIPFSKVKHSIVMAMLENGILKKQVIGRSKALAVSYTHLDVYKRQLQSI